MFKDLKAGDKVYIIFNSEEAVSVKEANVMEIKPPHIDMLSSIPNQLVVDLTIEEDGVKRIYSIPESLSVTYAKDKIIVSDTSELIKETEQIRLRLSEEIDEKVIERKRRKLDQTNDVLSKYSPYFRKEANVESRISNIEMKLEQLLTKLSV